jgi:hypothetical protein
MPPKRRGILHTGQYTLSESDDFKSVLSKMAECVDFPARQISHQEFLKLCGQFDDSIGEGRRWIDRSGVKLEDVYLLGNHVLPSEGVYEDGFCPNEISIRCPEKSARWIHCWTWRLRSGINRVVKVEKN